MIIRNALLEEINTIMNIYASAKVFMQKNGNRNQWINGYPSEELISNDIRNKNCYVCLTHENEIVGVFYFRQGNDPTYSKIYAGNWLNQNPYGVIHRMASSGKLKGIANHCLQWCFDQCNNIRVDTHQDNIVMQNILVHNDFIRCGIIYIENGSERIAFQKAKEK